MIDIILRTCSRVHALSHRPRLNGLGKREIVDRCVRSLGRSITASGMTNVRLYVIDDGSPSSDVDAWASTLAQCSIEARWILLEASPVSGSLRAAFDLARESQSELIYFVEDDYLHYPEAIGVMLRSFTQLRGLTPDAQVAITPYDCPDRYQRGVYPTTIEFSSGRYWRTTRHTTGTFMVPRQTFEMHLPRYLDYSRYGSDPGVSEDTSINLVYRNVPCFSPIPSLAIHLQYEDTIPLLLPDGGWQRLWDSVAP